MMLCSEQLTYFRLDENDRVTEVIPVTGSWFEKSVSELTDKGLAFAKVIECRIPVENAPAGFLPRENDLILRGSPPGGESLTAPVLKHTYGAATVKAVHDNRRTVLAPHFKLEAV